ncbi:MAG: hypothetical protein R3C99_23970 [Pirellulaceae bacterium]
MSNLAVNACFGKTRASYTISDVIGYPAAWPARPHAAEPPPARIVDGR